MPFSPRQTTVHIGRGRGLSDRFSTPPWIFIFKWNEVFKVQANYYGKNRYLGNLRRITCSTVMLRIHLLRQQMVAATGMQYWYLTNLKRNPGHLSNKQYTKIGMTHRFQVLSEPAPSFHTGLKKKLVVHFYILKCPGMTILQITIIAHNYTLHNRLSNERIHNEFTSHGQHIITKLV